jgi:sortase A
LTTIERRPALLWAERLLLVAGCLLLAIFAFARIDGWVSSRAALRQFDQGAAQVQRPAPVDGAKAQPTDDVDIDFSLWSEERISAFKTSLGLQQPRALAVLDLKRLRIRVPVFEGTDDRILNRGAGWIVGTARPGEAGNIGVAAHRDGFFRALKDVEAGDRIELQIPSKTMVYRVAQTEIVDPEDVQVLMPRAETTLTLVTCYPFYHIGSAPRRFVVHATLQASNDTRK